MYLNGGLTKIVHFNFKAAFMLFVALKIETYSTCGRDHKNCTHPDHMIKYV